MSKKIYVHHEDGDGKYGPIFTVPLMVEEKDLVEDVIAKFTNLFNDKFGKGDAPQHVKSATLYNSNEKAFKAKAEIYEDVDAMEDVFVILELKQAAPVTEKNLQKTSTAKITGKSNSNAKNVDDPYAEYRPKVKQLIANKSYRQARLICSQILKSLPLDPSKQDAFVFTYFIQSLAEMKLACGDYEAAAEASHQVMELNPASSVLLVLHAKILTLAKRHVEAVERLKGKASPLHTPPPQSSSSKPTPAINLYLDAQSLLAECVFEDGQHGKAVEIINSCMTYPQAEAHMGVLVAYSRFGWTYGKLQEPLRALLKAVTIDQHHKRVRRMLSQILNTGEGRAELYQQVVRGSAGTSSVYGFLATICKDYSALAGAVALFNDCLQMAPGTVNYALNLVHVYEVMNDYPTAVLKLKAFCQANSSLAISTSQSSRSSPFRLQTILGALEEAERLCSADPGTKHAAVHWVEASTDPNEVQLDHNSKSDPNPGLYKEGWVQLETPQGDRSGRPMYSESALTQYTDQDLDILAIGFTAVKLMYVQGHLPGLPALFTVLEPARLASKTPLHQTSIRNEHAYYQSIAQILSSCYRPQQDQLDGTGDGAGVGDVACAYARSEPVPHSAYNPCLLCPLTSLDATLVEARKHPVYVLGDSHSLPLGWRLLQMMDRERENQLQPRLLIPKLATGVKQWHLRRDGEFYPKANFNSVAESIPNNAELVVVVIGEIDCREGLPLAVERDYHPCLSTAMEATAFQFLKVLQVLAKRKAWQRVLIHPVVPVLNETRGIVMAFNEVYRKAVEKLQPSPSPSSSSSSCSLQWLDILDDLVEPCPAHPGDASLAGIKAGNASLIPPPPAMQLRPEYRLDGTHMSPSYVSLIAAAINKLPA